MLNGFEFIDLPLIITMLQDLCALQVMLAHVSGVVQCKSRSSAPATEDEIKFISSMKTLTKGRETFPESMKHGAVGNIEYYMMALISARKRMLEKSAACKNTPKMLVPTIWERGRKRFTGNSRIV